MKTPDKIYLCADAPRMYDWSSKPFEKGGNVEYIRKDALLEWAKGEMMPGRSKEGKGWNWALQALIDKIESL